MSSKSNLTEQSSRQRSKLLRERLSAKQRSKSVSGGGTLKLSPMQKEIWAHDKLQKESAAFTTIRAWRIHGELNVDALQTALQTLVNRQDALHMRIQVQDGEPTPVFEPVPSVVLQTKTVASMGLDAQDAELSAILREISLTSLDLENGPVFAFHLLHLKNDEHVLCALIHHIVTDDWSYGVFADELSNLYSTNASILQNPKPVEFSYKSHLQQHPSTEHSIINAHHGLNWPHGNIGKSQQTVNPCARIVTTHLSQSITQNLVKTARSEQMTLFSMLVAAYQLLLSRFCGQQEVTVGVAYANRPMPEIEKLIGMFVRFGGLDADLESDKSLRQVARQAHENLLEMNSDARFPETKGVEASLTYYNSPEQSLRLDGLRTSKEQLSAYPLALPLHLSIRDDDSGLIMSIIAREDLFDQNTVEQLANAYLLILTQFSTNPDIPIADIKLLGVNEATQLAEVSVSVEPYSDGQDIPKLFEAIAAKHPDKAALTSPHQTWSYAELNLAADRMAQWLQTNGVSNGFVVGLCLPRGAQLIIATLGLLKAGAVVTPIDPEYPNVRLEQMVETAECQLILCVDIKTSEKFPANLVRIIPNLADLECYDPVSSFARDTLPSRAAYLVFTSGSTGRPKAVITPHSGVVRMAAGLFCGDVSPEDRFVQLASPSFDGAFIEIWGALLNGAELVTPEGNLENLHEITDFLCAYKITTGFFTTGLFNLIIDEDPKAFASFRWLSAGGEALSPLHINKSRDALPNVRIMNVYGPTENSALTTYYEITSSVGNIVPIGRPMPNNMTFVLSDTLTPLPPGFVGELCVGGDGLALGYKNLPDETGAKFVTIPGNQIGLPLVDSIRLYRTGDRVRWSQEGQIEYLGRIDAQVKLNGYRIELAEIEHALETHPDVRGAIVIPQYAQIDKRVTGLTAFLEIPDGSINENSIRQYARGLLPRFLMPTQFQQVTRFPLTTSGKVDRATLAIKGQKTGNLKDTELSGVDPRLVTIWSELLGRKITDKKADFFALGGHSLLVMRMLAQVEREFGCKLDVARFLHEPYLDSLQAQTLLQPRAIVNQSKRIALLHDGDPSLAPVMCMMGINGSYMWSREIVKAWPQDRPIYGISFGEQSARIHDPTSLDELALEIVEEISGLFGNRPVHLIGYSFGALLAFVISGKMKQANMPDAHLVMLDGGLNLTKLKVSPPRDEPLYPDDLLKRLLAEHSLQPLETQFDLIACRRAFPWHKSETIQSWANFANKGLRVHEFDTFHSNIIHGKWALKSAIIIENVIEGKTQSGTIVSARRWSEETHKLLCRARDAALAGDTSSALVAFEFFAAGVQPTPPWVYAIIADLHSQNDDRKSLRSMVKIMHKSESVTSNAWMEVAKIAGRTKFEKISKNCLQRANSYTGHELTGEFQLALMFIRNNELDEAERIAESLTQSERWVIEGQLLHSLIAKRRGNKKQSIEYAELALTNEDIGVKQVAFALLRILAPYDANLARAAVVRKLDDFPNNPKLVAIRDKLSSSQT